MVDLDVILTVNFSSPDAHQGTLYYETVDANGNALAGGQESGNGTGPGLPGSILRIDFSRPYNESSFHSGEYQFVVPVTIHTDQSVFSNELPNGDQRESFIKLMLFSRLGRLVQVVEKKILVGAGDLGRAKSRMAGKEARPRQGWWQRGLFARR